MISIENVRAWVEADGYVNLLEGVAEPLRLSVSSGVIPDVILQHDANKFKAAHLDPADLSVIASNIHLVRKYVSAKLQALGGSADEQEGRSPEDEGDLVLKTHPFYRNFLNIYLIELHFLIYNPGALEGYLKAVRVPGAKKYAAQLAEMYIEIAR